jgi:hypothetical protein
MVEATGSNPVFRSTFGCALAPPATRAPWERRSGDVHGVAPHVQREHLVGSPITRAWTQPKVDYMSCSSSWPRMLGLHPGDTGSNPVHDAKPEVLCAHAQAETGRKDRAAPELVTGPIWFVSSVEERLPVEERAAGSIPARTAIHAAIAQR